MRSKANLPSWDDPLPIDAQGAAVLRLLDQLVLGRIGRWADLSCCALQIAGESSSGPKALGWRRRRTPMSISNARAEGAGGCTRVESGAWDTPCAFSSSWRRPIGRCITPGDDPRITNATRKPFPVSTT